ncbi:MAG TPA: hypothetical protein VEA69_15010 [Tepidisphaeraceae bacterium]|nr:hypothetical protein [Tepidisphaeraceae bacterium]
MYGRQSGRPLVPRNGHTLVVGIVARISGCANQTELSLEDQVDHGKEVVVGLYDGPVEYRLVQTTGKGERLDRPELAEVEQMLRRGELDLLICEDLGRLVRGTAAKDLCAIAVDNFTRVIAPNDFIDTNDETWEEDVIAACRDHVGHNAHTSKRLKHKLMNRFVKFGGATARPVAGYAVPADAKTYDDWRKDEAATPVIAEGLRLLRETLSGEAVADHFNNVPYNGGVGFPPGPYCRRPRWDGRMALRFYRNRVLGGFPQRGARHTVKRHESGRRVSVRSPHGPQYRACPHLAHVDVAELDAALASVAKRNAAMKRKAVGGADPLLRVSRSDGRFPAGSATCWYCGRPCVWGGNGVTGNLMCSGSRDRRCWSSVGFGGQLAAERTAQTIAAALRRVEGLDAQFQALVAAARSGQGGLDARRGKLRRDEEVLDGHKRKLKDVMKALGSDPLVLDAVGEVRTEEARLAAERRAIDALAGRPLDVPGSLAGLRDQFEQKLKELAARPNGREVHRLLRTLVPQFHVYLVRLADGGHPLPRARLRLALDGLVPDAARVRGLPELLTLDATVDLFEPPQREHIRERAVALTAQGRDQRAVARELGVSQAAVQKALALDRLVRERGLAGPYVVLTEPPDDYPKLRRHRNRKYAFDPLAGYEPPPL